MTAAIRPKPKPMSEGLQLVERLRLDARIYDSRGLCKQAGVPYIQYLQARLGDAELSASQLESLTKALTTFTGDRA